MTGKEKISIIITARNNGEFLAEAIESCLRQTVTPFEIIYSDDFSSDDSIKIAGEYPEVSIIKHERHVGVVAARNGGADNAKGEILVFLDGDDILPPGFLAKHLEVFDESTPFVYCSAQTFGMGTQFWKVYAWQTLFLWNRNFVNTTAMMWRDAFIIAGKWQDTCENTMWDWSLALRLSRLGIPRKSPAVLNYRQHPGSWSRLKEKTEGKLLPLSESIRREVVNVTVGLIYSGRIEGFLTNWMECLIEDVSILRNKPQLIIINNSESIIDIEIYREYFSEIKVITGHGKLTWDNEVDRRNKVCELLSDQYNMIIENSTGELIHLREDDILSLSGSFKKIFDFVTSGNPVKASAAGIYLNRNPKYRKIVGGFYNKSNPRGTRDIDTTPTREPFQIDYTGTGFLIFWKELCPKFSPYIDGIQAHDWAWALKLKKLGRELWMIPDAICRHYSSQEEYLEYSPEMEIGVTNTFTRELTADETNNLDMSREITINNSTPKVIVR